MYCSDCDEDDLSVRAALMHEELYGHEILLENPRLAEDYDK